MHPKSLLRCSDALLLRLVAIMMAAERLGAWPSTIGVIMIILLPKPDGGLRPIGLFPSLIRIWMRARLDVARKWQSVHERAFLYAGPGKGADVAAWKQAAVAEMAASASLQYCCVLLDLVKAFDNVPYDWLVRQGARCQYDMWLLSLSIAAYRLGRVLCINGVCSIAVVASRG